MTVGQAGWRRFGWMLIALVGIGAIAIALISLYRDRSARRSETPVVLVGDIENKTGEPIFQDVVRETLLTALDQSPYLSLAQPGRIQEALLLAGKPAGSTLDEATSRAICARESIPVLIIGALVRNATAYAVDLRGIDCPADRRLWQVNVPAADQQAVLSAIDRAALDVREALGEPARSRDEFRTAVSEAVTASLPGLRLFALGNRRRDAGQAPEAFPFFHRAVLLDPEFALALARLGETFTAVGDAASAAGAYTRSFERRQRLTRKDALRITAAYYGSATGELDKYAEALQEYQRTYPHDPFPRHALADLYNLTGEFSRGASEELGALGLSPTRSVPVTLLTSYMGMGKFAEARRFYEQALAQRPDLGFARLGLFAVAFVQNDRAVMQQQADWAAGRPEEALLLMLRAQAAAYGGRLHESRTIHDRAAALMTRAERTPDILPLRTSEALVHALYGDPVQAARVPEATAGDRGAAQTGIVRALIGHHAEAEAIATALRASFPRDTLVTGMWLPLIRGARLLSERRFNDAVAALDVARRFDLSPSAQYLPIYLRAESYRLAGNGFRARAEYQKILDHRGAAPVSPVSALAQAGVARATFLMGDVAASRNAYEKALETWKDAEGSVPLIAAVRQEAAAVMRGRAP